MDDGMDLQPPASSGKITHPSFDSPSLKEVIFSLHLLAESETAALDDLTVNYRLDNQPAYSNDSSTLILE